MSALPKWDETRTETLRNFVGDESPISLSTVAEAATELETSTRSIAAKLRKLGYEVEKLLLHHRVPSLVCRKKNFALS